ncbi:MAG: phospholipase D-like domain-containing protein [Oligoflexia bacterium]
MNRLFGSRCELGSGVRFSVALAILSVCGLNSGAQLGGAGSSPEAEVYFSPHQGKQAFERMYSLIAQARHEVKVTVYSWSDAEFGDALAAAAKNGAKVRVVLHPDLEEKVSPQVVNLEKLGIEFKVASRNMHEKFIYITQSKDPEDATIVNSSANFSRGAATKYSENFVVQVNAERHLARQYRREFAWIWDTADDFVSGVSGEKMATAEDVLSIPEVEANFDPLFFSSSMNTVLVPNAKGSKNAEKGRYFSMRDRLGPDGKQTWVIRDLFIEHIDAAQSSVDCAFNHFNIEEISQALVRAASRGVKVRLNVDNQEFVSRVKPNDIEMTPRFVDQWQKLPGNAGKVPPVRVKFYSYYPHPAYWLLNHHKYCLFDYDPSKPETVKSATLLTGSYNLSETAEHNQFDNMVRYGGRQHPEMIEKFYGEMENLWSWGRTPDDQPDPTLTASYSNLSNGSLSIHFQKAQALTWPEMVEVRSRANRVAPGLFFKLTKRTSGCMFYDPKTQRLWGGSPASCKPE